MTLPNEFTVYGSEEMLKPLILQLLAQHYDDGETGEIGGGGYREPLSPDFKDWLQVTFHWGGVTEITGKSHTVEKSIRLKEIDPKTVTLAYLKELGTKILAKFNNLNFKTGHVKAKYSHWKHGIQTWGYFDTRETGFRIIESMADIVGKSIDRQLLKYEDNAAPAEAFPVQGERTTVASKSVRIKSKAPIANMRFRAATVTFPYINHTEMLCSMSGYVIKDLSFLNAYED